MPLLRAGLSETTPFRPYRRDSERKISMKKISLLSLAVAGVLFTPGLAQAQFASSVASYNPGTGTTAAYQDPSHALGAPTVFIGYQDADPFNAPYAGSDLTSVGAGGWLTLQFAQPVLNTSHTYGLDFQIFGNAGFVIVNGDYSGGGITDGTLYSANAGSTRVSVSQDGVSFFTLNPALAPTVDGYFPSDAAGDFRLPVNPALSAGSFAGLDLAGIRTLYAGSGGGTGFDISWAQDGLGDSVFLGSISYVRVEVLGGKSEIDAIVAVPEPTVLALGLIGVAALTLRRKHH